MISESFEIAKIMFFLQFSKFYLEYLFAIGKICIRYLFCGGNLFQESFVDVASAEAADAVELNEDATLMLVFHDYAFDAGIGTFGDADMVSNEEVGGVRLINDDVIPIGFNDATETIELLIGNDKVVVVAVGIDSAMIVIRCEAGDGELEKFLELIACAVQEEQG